MLSDEVFALVRRRRNEGFGIDDIMVELRIVAPGAAREDVSAVFAAIKAGTAPLLERRPRGAAVHRGDGDGVRVPAIVLAERRARQAAPPRDLTAFLMGDPPPGRSALDARKGDAP